MNSIDDQAITLEAVLEKVNQSEIASIKGVVSGILKTINDIRSSAADIEKIIKLDPPLVAKVLKVANSAYYSPPRPIDSLRDAVVRIGLDALKYIALSQKVKDIFGDKRTTGSYQRRLLWKHSVAVALMAKLMYNRKFEEGGENLYAAGLLHDIGIIAIDQFLADHFEKIIARSEHDNINLIQAEDEILGFKHTDLAREIMKQWNFPEELIESATYHHEPLEAKEPHQNICMIMFVADYFCQENEIGFGDMPERDETIFFECLDKLGIDMGTLNTIISELNEEIEKIEQQGMFS